MDLSSFGFDNLLFASSALTGVASDDGDGDNGDGDDDNDEHPLSRLLLEERVIDEYEVARRALT